MQKPPAKIGRPLLLGERLDEVVKAKVKAVRDSAGIIDRHTVQCLGFATMQVSFGLQLILLKERSRMN